MAADENSVVRTVGLTKTFRDFWFREKVTAVRELDLEIASGEVYGLLGPNGSGKSTTLKIVLGLMFPTRGLVRVFGRQPGDVATKSRIGFLPEESYLYPFLNAHETLDYYGRLFHQGRYERRRRIGMLLEMVGLSGAAYRRVGEYSKGMQRRIGMAQALINDPELLILDEPTSGMDPLAARQFKDLIAELSRRGKTIILSSHLLADMEDVCDRVGILYAGQLRSQGALGELLSRRGMTTITTDELDEETARRIRDLLTERAHKVLAIETPKDRLESLFLRIVREAQTRPDRPAGAVATGQLAEFLRADEPAAGQELIDDLVAAGAAAQPVAAPAEAPPPPPAARAAGEVIDDLLAAADKTDEAPAAPEAPAEGDEAPGRDVNRGVIDSLIQRPEREKTDDA
ncbi:MAG TPA: ABC transporter ATP-binding protein [Phycisphaerae bacterium]|nr:ABC transporter ATP-binding protein [Phycisphaerae bacterium]